MKKIFLFTNQLFWSFVSITLFLPVMIAQADTVGRVTGPELLNPIGVNSFQELIEKVLRVVLDIGVPVATLFIIYSGFLFVKAGGSPEKLKTAKETFFWTIIGTAVLLGAWVLAKAIRGTIGSL
jgi:hypothetical protein